MKEKRTFVMCARLLPYQRQCKGCPHRKNCSLYYEGDFEFKADSHEEKAITEHNEDMRELAKEAI